MSALEPDIPATPPPLAAAIPAGLVRPDERVILALKPSWAFVPLVCRRFWLWLAVLALGAWAVNHWGLFTLPIDRLLLGAVAAGVIRLAISLLQWLCRIYVMTDQRVIRIKGVLWVRVFECGLSRVQNTDLSMPLAQRALGAGTLYFATAGTAGRDAAWVRRAQKPGGTGF
jgi:uncharacterized membrane protein YdbT with pleckstrin-like domain